MTAPRQRLPVESLRPGGLPADYWRGPRDASEALSALIDDGRRDRNDASVAWPAVRTCACGAQVLRDSRADRQHRATCGEPDAVPEDRGTGKVLDSHCRNSGCGQVINHGALYCSHACQLEDTEKRESRAASTTEAVTRGTGAVIPAPGAVASPAEAVTEGRFCENCGRPGLSGRADARFCSAACRVAAHRRSRKEARA